MQAPLLIEIGCEEIPARVIPGAASDLRDRVVTVLDQAGLPHGAAACWGGSRRLAVRVDSVEGRQPDRDEQVLGPPAGAAFGPDGSPTGAATGFARKHGIDPSTLQRIETERGVYSGFRRSVPGRTVGEILATTLPQSVAAMSFPKTMRWGDGRWRWVRPVHWVLALHGEEVLQIELFGVRAGGTSWGHRFLAAGSVFVRHPDQYLEALRTAFVVVDPAERRAALLSKLSDGAASKGGTLVDDPALLEEVSDMIEWPGVVAGHFDQAYLELPREILVTTLRHHQKSFCVEGSALKPMFLSAANTDRDPHGHVRRGNEWVVTGRLDDARFFWREDRKIPLPERLPQLTHVIFHQKVGTYAEKAARMQCLARDLAAEVSPDNQEHAARAAQLAKCDLVTSLVGEFPELQGIVGGLLLREEGAPEAVWQAVYEHYGPTGPDDALPRDVGSVVSVVDKLDTVTQLIRVGEIPTGSRDPLGIRRSLNAVFRIIEEKGWLLSLKRLIDLTGQDDQVLAFLKDRYINWLRDRGFTINEILSVLRPRINENEWVSWPLVDLRQRLEAVRTVRGRKDFEQLVDLTKRVDNILTKGSAERQQAIASASGAEGFVDEEPAVQALEAELVLFALDSRSDVGTQNYRGRIEQLARLVNPVDRFFSEALVLDPRNPIATRHRTQLLAKLRTFLTRDFDIRELAGESSRRA